MFANHTDAYKRFLASTEIGYIQWHDGEGYDLEALPLMIPAERDEVVTRLGAKAQGWREVEVYHAIATPAAQAALWKALGDPSTDTRLHAAEKLHMLGQLPGLAPFVAKELGTATVGEGMVIALRLAGENPSPEVRQALLMGARNRPEVAVHYAAMLCFLAGAATEEFDWAMRPFFLRFGEQSSPEDRAAAFLELCKIAGMAPRVR